MQPLKLKLSMFFMVLVFTFAMGSREKVNSEVLKDQKDESNTADEMKIHVVNYNKPDIQGRFWLMKHIIDRMRSIASSLSTRSKSQQKQLEKHFVQIVPEVGDQATTKEAILFRPEVNVPSVTNLPTSLNRVTLEPGFSSRFVTKKLEILKPLNNGRLIPKELSTFNPNIYSYFLKGLTTLEQDVNDYLVNHLTTLKPGVGDHFVKQLGTLDTGGNDNLDNHLTTLKPGVGDHFVKQLGTLDTGGNDRLVYHLTTQKPGVRDHFVKQLGTLDTEGNGRFVKQLLILKSEEKDHFLKQLTKLKSEAHGKVVTQLLPVLVPEITSPSSLKIDDKSSNVKTPTKRFIDHWTWYVPSWNNFDPLASNIIGK